MKKYFSIVTILLIFIMLLPVHSSFASVQFLRTISLPDVYGRIDHMDIDPGQRRLYVAALGNNSVEVIDVQTGIRVKSIQGLDAPQGVLVVPERKKLFITNGGDGSLRIYDGNTLTLLETIKFSSDADNIRYDQTDQQVYVGYGDMLGIVDGVTLRHTANISLNGHPESFQLEKNGNRIFVNVPSAGHVAVIDKNSRIARAFWPVIKNCRNFPMALDETGDRLFIGCRNPPLIIVYDTITGKPVAKIKIAGDADDIFFDVARRRIYVSCGAGFLQVFEARENKQYTLLQNIPTGRGARTSLFVPKEDLIYVAIPGSLNGEAEIRVFTIRP